MRAKKVDISFLPDRKKAAQISVFFPNEYPGKIVFGRNGSQAAPFYSEKSRISTLKARPSDPPDQKNSWANVRERANDGDSLLDGMGLFIVGDKT